MRYSKAAIKTRHLHVAHLTLMDSGPAVTAPAGPSKAPVYSTARYSQPTTARNPFAERLKGLVAEGGERRAEGFLVSRWGFLR